MTDETGTTTSTSLEGSTDPLTDLIDYARSIEPEDEDAVQRRILESMLKAKSAEELLNAGASIPASQLVDIPLRIERIRAAESTMGGGMDMYLHVDATILANKDHVTFSCSARDVVVKLLLASKEGFLPMNAKLEQSKKATKNGYFPMFIRSVADDELPF